MGEPTEIFLDTFETLRSVKRAIDGELDVGLNAPPLDEPSLERLWEVSHRHAVMTQKLQDMIHEYGADDAFHYEVELLRESFENTKGEIAQRLRARREQPSPGQGHATERSRRDHDAETLRRDQAARLRSGNAVRQFHRDVGYRVHIVEVSAAGARLRQVERLPANARVTVRYLHLSIRASVEWSDDTFTSLQFRAPLSAEEVQVLRSISEGNQEA